MWNSSIPPPPHPAAVAARHSTAADYRPQHSYSHQQPQHHQQQQAYPPPQHHDQPQQHHNAGYPYNNNNASLPPPPPPPSYSPATSYHQPTTGYPPNNGGYIQQVRDRDVAVDTRASTSSLGEPAWQRRRVEHPYHQTPQTQPHADASSSSSDNFGPRSYAQHQSNNHASHSHYNGQSHSNSMYNNIASAPSNSSNNNNIVASSTSSTTTAPQPPPPPALLKLLTVRPEQYDEFLNSRALSSLVQGTFVLPQHIPASPPPINAATITIDLDLWNNYWGDFSEHFSAHDDAIQNALRDQNKASGQEMGAGVGKLNRRGVIVKFPTSSPGQQFVKDSFASPNDLLQQHMLRLATKFGVVEFCRVQHDEIRIQFTISSAAIEFASFVRSLDASAAFPSHLLQHRPHSTASGRVHVFLLDHRPPLANTTPTNSSSSNGHQQQQQQLPLCTKLILGKRLDIPSMFLNALFRDLFEADHIEYQSGSFVVAFATHALCKYALHVLQQSFRQVFGLTLGYYDQKDVPALDLIG